LQQVVLNEHFRCASEIIAFSNTQFYDNQLIPLRLPTQSERLTPSIVDVRIQDGVKVGKTNEHEVNEIVQRVAAIADQQKQQQQTGRCRSIGIISLMGDEQSRLIRSRLLDAIGPQRMAQHSILVGDPPSFQGTERDSTYLLYFVVVLRQMSLCFLLFLCLKCFGSCNLFSNLSVNGMFTWTNTNSEPIGSLPTS
jgi:AAA domain